MVPPTGGHGVPDGDVPEVVELAWEFPDEEEPEFVEPELDPDPPEPDEPALDEFEFDVPAFGVAVSGDPGVPGEFPHGEVVEFPGVVFGSVVEVDGCTVLPLRGAG